MATNLTARISPSSLSDTSCNYRFFTLRVLKQWPPRPAITNASFGIAWHELAGKVYNPRNGTPPNVIHLEAWSRQAFRGQRYDDEAAREEDRVRCLRMLKGYIANDDPDDAANTLAVEHWVERPITRNGEPFFVLSGRLDRVLLRYAPENGKDGPVTLVGRDYKLGRPKTDLEAAFINMWLLKLGFPGYDNYVFELDWVDEGGRLDRETITAADVRGQHAAVMDRLQRVLLSDTHPQEPGEHCQWCPLRDTCESRASVGIDYRVDAFAEGE